MADPNDDTRRPPSGTRDAPRRGVAELGRAVRDNGTVVLIDDLNGRAGRVSVATR